MLDLLAARFTGEGGPRAGDPRTLLSAWKRKAGSSDTDLPEREALDLAQELGASQLLLGSVVGTPPRIVLHANLVAVPSGTVRATADAEGPADRLGALVDRLAADLLAGSARQADRFAGAIARPPCRSCACISTEWPTSGAADIRRPGAAWVASSSWIRRSSSLHSRS